MTIANDVSQTDGSDHGARLLLAQLNRGDDSNEDVPLSQVTRLFELMSTDLDTNEGISIKGTRESMII